MNDTESDSGNRDFDEEAFIEALKKVSIPEGLVSSLLSIPTMEQGDDRVFPIVDPPSLETQKLETQELETQELETQELETQETVTRGPLSQGPTWKRLGLGVVVAASLLGVLVGWRWLLVREDGHVPPVEIAKGGGREAERIGQPPGTDGETLARADVQSFSTEAMDQRLLDLEVRGDLLRASLEQMSVQEELSELRRRYLTTVRRLPAREHHALALALAAETKIQWSGSSEAVLETLQEVASHFPETRGGQLASNLLSH